MPGPGLSARRPHLGQPGRHDYARVVAVAVLPDGRVVTGGGDDRVRLWGVLDSSSGAVCQPA